MALLLTASRGHAASPEIDRITPCGAQRGTEVDVTLDGPRLADGQELFFYYPGIRVTKFEVAGGKQVKAHLTIASDCRLGLHALRVRTASGISNLKTFSVGPLPEIQESEPNDDFQKPQKIPMNVTVNGVIQNEDVDYFLVEAKKGQRIAAEIEGLRLGETFFDPYVAILTTDRFVLASADDTPLVYQDCVATAVAPADGSYIIQVRESAFGGSGLCRYRLHVGHFPRPLAVYPAGGKFGQTLDVQWLGDASGPWTSRVTLPSTAQAMFGLAAQDAQGLAPTQNEFRVGDLVNVMEKEPNNSPGEATSFDAPAALNGIIDKPGDIDRFKFHAKKGQVYDVRVYGRAVRSPLDSVLSVQRVGGAEVASNDDSGTPDSYVRFTAPEDDQYVISVRDQLGMGGPEYVYRIEVTDVKPRLTMGLSEREAFVDVTAPVPQGNRVAMMVSAQREDFGGDLAVELRDLPAGVTAQTVPITGDQTAAPVLLSATAEARLSGTLSDVIGRTGAAPAIEGHLKQRTSLVRGDNNREVWNHTTERMAVAVTRKAPFRVEIVQPKVPLVASGAMDLKIVASRDPEFKAPITLSMLYNPPGVSSPTTVTIPEGKNEILMPLTANSGAMVRVWKIAVLAQATVGDGPLTVSSQLADLDVAAPLIKFTFPAIAVDQGQETQLAIEVQKQKDFAGSASVELLGLPNEVTSQPQQITKDSTQVVFPIKTTANSPPGQHKSLLCRAVIMAQGEPITHMLGSGELRIQKPLPRKAAEQPKPQSTPQPKAAKPAEKPLGRLEQLRLERQKAQGAAVPADAPTKPK